MSRLWEAGVVLGAALALHAAAFAALAPDPYSGGGGGGAEGADSVTVAAVPPGLAAMVEAWETPPAASEAPELPAAPEIATPPERVRPADPVASRAAPAAPEVPRPTAWSTRCPAA